MMKSYRIFLTLSITALFIGCDKPEDIECDVAVLCVRNISSDPDSVLVYRWSDSDLDTLYPGECAIQEVEDVHVTYDRFGNVKSESSSTVFFEAGTNYAFKINDCYIEKELEANVYLKANCDNGIFEPEKGELDTDCGGFCDNCPPPQFSCELSMDHISWDGIIGTSDLYSSDEMQGGAEERVFLFTFDNFTELTIKFQEKNLVKDSKKYYTGNFDGQVIIHYNQGNGFWYPLDDQELYIVKEDDGTFTVSFCDLEFFKDQFSAMANAKLTLEL